jgi:hypothetical protein
VILLERLRHISDVTRVAERLQQELAVPFVIDTHEIYVSSRLGIALSTTGYEPSNSCNRGLSDANTARGIFFSQPLDATAAHALITAAPQW